MIPVRVRSDAKPVLASDRRFAARRSHLIDDQPCPVCDGPLGDGVTVLVFVGIAPEDRKPGGYTTGGAVAVHAACAGVPDEEPQRLTSADPEPPAGTVVRDDLGRTWGRDWDGGGVCWTRRDSDDSDPETWTKVAGNYGPVTVVEVPQE